MAKLKEIIKTEIKNYVGKCGGSYSDWYVGIASDPRQRLFNDHNVDEGNGYWIFRECESSSVAREIEEYFINTLGTDGGFGGGDYTSRYVYAYTKTSSTTE
jgi:hypothetical protein